MFLDSVDQHFAAFIVVQRLHVVGSVVSRSADLSRVFVKLTAGHQVDYAMA